MQLALGELDRRDRTKEQLRQLLLRKSSASKGAEADAGAESPDPAPIDAVLDRLEASGVIDDRRFAEHFVRGARNRGASAAKVQQKLSRRGIQREGIEDALKAVAAEGGDDLAAAQSYAKKRRLAERYDLSDPGQRQKAMASLARQGFSAEVARQALGRATQGDPDDDG